MRSERLRELGDILVALARPLLETLFDDSLELRGHVAALLSDARHRIGRDGREKIERVRAAKR